MGVGDRVADLCLPYCSIPVPARLPKFFPLFPPLPATLGIQLHAPSSPTFHPPFSRAPAPLPPSTLSLLSTTTPQKTGVPLLCSCQIEASTSPPGIPRAFDRGGENLNFALEGWGIRNGFISCSCLNANAFFSVFVGFDVFIR